ncbi:MAG: trypsin-like peptidase domain-containing protein [candidate division Zixibacteria bacterium]|nr:trypsin-like peptidase domain-containing protein [candidate division Zixibacteria bacterium]
MKRCPLIYCFLISWLLPVLATAVPPLQQAIYNARDRVLPALVHIQPVITDYRTGKMIKQSVVGSGIIFHKDGYVVTNYHVAGKAERIICTLYDKEQLKAELIGGDPMTDIAIIKLNLSDYKGNLHVAEFGNSDSIQVGQFVLAMGSPLALSRSVSCGVISTTDRYFSGDVHLPSGERTGVYNNWIQTDAAINPGNSGGPLVDLNGKVVGINSRATLFANNIGFAIPINIVKFVVESILTKGKVIRSWIGVQCQELQDLEGWFGTALNEGVLIASIDPHSPAEDAGLRAGDIILKVDSQSVSARFAEELPTFYKMIADYPAGKKISLTIRREDVVINIDIITRELGNLLGEDLDCKEWGFTVKGMTKQMAVDNQLEDTLGIYVSGVKRVGPAGDAGLVPGDVIKGINEKPVETFREFYDRYNEIANSAADRVLFTVKRYGSTKFILIKMDNSKTTEPGK